MSLTPIGARTLLLLIMILPDRDKMYGDYDTLTGDHYEFGTQCDGCRKIIVI